MIAKYLSGVGGSSLETPDKKRKKSRKYELDDFDIGVTRRIIYNFYATEKCAPTVSRLREKLFTDIGFGGSNSTLRSILKQIGFRWCKTKSQRLLLIEKHDIKTEKNRMSQIYSPLQKRKQKYYLFR